MSNLLSLIPVRSRISNGGLSLFDSLFDDFFHLTPTKWEDGLSPKLDILESEKEILIRAELAGIDEKNLDVTLEDGLLTISGEKKSEVKKEQDKYYHSEISFGKFSRSVRLPDDIDPESVKATYKNGLLDIAIGRTEKENRLKKIPVSAK